MNLTKDKMDVNNTKEFDVTFFNKQYTLISNNLHEYYSHIFGNETIDVDDINKTLVELTEQCKSIRTNLHLINNIVYCDEFDSSQLLLRKILIDKYNLLLFKITKFKMVVEHMVKPKLED